MDIPTLIGVLLVVAVVAAGRIVEIKSPLILAPGPAALTEGLDAIVAALRPD